MSELLTPWTRRAVAVVGSGGALSRALEAELRKLGAWLESEGAIEAAFIVAEPEAASSPEADQAFFGQMEPLMLRAIGSGAGCQIVAWLGHGEEADGLREQQRAAMREGLGQLTARLGMRLTLIADWDPETAPALADAVASVLAAAECLGPASASFDLRDGEQVTAFSEATGWVREAASPRMH